MTAIEHMARQLEQLHEKPDRQTLVLKLRAAGLSLNQIAVEAKISRTAVFNIIDAARKETSHEN